MQHADFNGDAEALEEELDELKKAFDSRSRRGRAITPISDNEGHEAHAKRGH